jgi:A/G-specific adenine glycosylase
VNKTADTIFFTRQLMQWNLQLNRRQMPWKGERDPYKIWLSEIILQQTRVEQGLDYYNRFIKTYPNVKKLAAAEAQDVFKLWEGLGYYSRCKNLLAAARFIAFELKGKFPASYDEILLLKGVGPYTASAIASFAYDLPRAVVDGNVSRVLARYFGIETPIDSTAGKKIFAALSTELLDKTAPALYNQAIMDFGATVCKPQLPLCPECPLQPGCTAYKNGLVNVLPIKEKKLVKKDRWFFYLVVQQGEKIFVRKRTGKDIWQNLHEFILIETPAKQAVEELIASPAFTAIAGPDYSIHHISARHKQMLTHQTIHGFFIHLENNGRPVPGYELLDTAALKKRAFPRFINAWLQEYKKL